MVQKGGDVRSLTILINPFYQLPVVQQQLTMYLLYLKNQLMNLCEHCLHTILEIINYWCRSHSKWLRTNGPKFAISIYRVGYFLSSVSDVFYQITLLWLSAAAADNHLSDCTSSWICYVLALFFNLHCCVFNCQPQCCYAKWSHKFRTSWERYTLNSQTPCDTLTQYL